MREASQSNRERKQGHVEAQGCEVEAETMVTEGCGRHFPRPVESVGCQHLA